MPNKKNLLIYAHYYIPDTASTGQILRELAEGMLDKFNITVICVVPSYLGTIEEKLQDAEILRRRNQRCESPANPSAGVQQDQQEKPCEEHCFLFLWGNECDIQGRKAGLCVLYFPAAYLAGLLGVWGKWVNTLSTSIHSGLQPGAGAGCWLYQE